MRRCERDWPAFSSVGTFLLRPSPHLQTAIACPVAVERASFASRRDFWEKANRLSTLVSSLESTSLMARFTSSRNQSTRSLTNNRFREKELRSNQCP
jgi:hypothetical protein